MFVKADAFDVVPRRRLVTPIALIHLRDAAALRHASVLLTRNSFGHHVEMHHVVARGRLVALRARERIWGRMLKLLNSPLRGCMAVGAVRSKQSHMSIFRPMTRPTIQRHLQRSEVRVASGGC